MPFILILIIAALLTESFATSWYSGAVNGRTGEKPPYSLPVVLAVVKSLVFALGVFSGSFASAVLPWFYTTMAYALMFIIGLKMALETIRFKPEERIILIDSTRTLWLLSVAGSFNTLFIGISLGLAGAKLLDPVIAVFTGTLIAAFIALVLGKRFGLRPGIRFAGIAAGLIIAVVSLRFFILYFIR